MSHSILSLVRVSELATRSTALMYMLAHGKAPAKDGVPLSGTAKRGYTKTGYAKTGCGQRHVLSAHRVDYYQFERSASRVTIDDATSARS